MFFFMLLVKKAYIQVKNYFLQKERKCRCFNYLGLELMTNKVNNEVSNKGITLTKQYQDTDHFGSEDFSQVVSLSSATLSPLELSST